jgi:hypothetical protein
MRAYATNAAGTSYGNEITFSTCTLNTAGSATSTTVFVNTALTPITRNTTGATGIGTATGLPTGVTASWSNNVITISGTPTSTGTFSYSIPLSGGCGSVNATGTITVTVFTCSTSTVTDIDGNSYNTVMIVNQCWTKENLRVRRYNDGTWIPFDNSGGPGGNGSGQTWSSLTYGAHTIYGHDSTATTGNLAVYGYLYNWYAVKGIATSGSTTYKNICPTGWHVPSDTEWETNQAVNVSGFSVLRGGTRNIDGGWYDGGVNAYFWSATEVEGYVTLAWMRYLARGANQKTLGNSVRCLKNN